jgi:transcriptional regulator with XRE-family HTH domain
MNANGHLHDMIRRGSMSRATAAAGLSLEQLAAYEAGLLAELLEAANVSCSVLSPYERDLIKGTAAMAQLLVSDSLAA